MSTMPKTVTLSKCAPRPRPREVIGGVDTHGDSHTFAALDQLGGLLGTTTLPATAAGYRDGLAWLAGYGPVGAVGVEGTGSYGAGLSRALPAGPGCGWSR